LCRVGVGCLSINLYAINPSRKATFFLLRSSGLICFRFIRLLHPPAIQSVSIYVHLWLRFRISDECIHLAIRELTAAFTAVTSALTRTGSGKSEGASKV